MTGAPVVELVAALIAASQTVATAESLTAGLIAATIADVPGASAVLRGGLIVYATDLKHQLAGVSEEVLATDGPVSATTAVQLAQGARTRCGADWGIGITGVAGPDSQDGHPVGTVYLGLAGAEQSTVIGLKLAGDRATIRTGAVAAAVRELLAAVTVATPTRIPDPK
ncbi:CinA family protein [Nocardia camponoti]|uniref:Competence protein n=1 Tax=Nocardia camponoti TaxID=1616106 RepID=A0A917V5R9_9NOCA|nr:nicotinamide-nucleotide amidohydrolase family protein [Nocardia camponoti]GGK41806.1 competence protein [Nocardia camponoti]